MRTSRRITPRLEGFESRELMSGLPAVAPMIYPPPVLVSGHAEGAALISPSMPDVGTRYVLVGSGQVGAMGPVLVHGELQTSSISGRPIGTVTLENQLGRVVLQITDRAAPAVPDAYQFVVSEATGPYSDLLGTGGVLDLQVDGAAGVGSFSMDINPFVILADGGQ